MTYPINEINLKDRLTGVYIGSALLRMMTWGFLPRITELPLVALVTDIIQGQTMATSTFSAGHAKLEGVRYMPDLDRYEFRLEWDDVEIGMPKGAREGSNGSLLATAVCIYSEIDPTTKERGEDLHHMLTCYIRILRIDPEHPVRLVNAGVNFQLV